MEHESAIDLSLRSSEADKIGSSQILKPTPKPPWTILWYQNLWPMLGSQGPISTTADFTTRNQRLSSFTPLAGGQAKNKTKSGLQILGNVTINSQNIQDLQLVTKTDNELTSSGMDVLGSLDKGEHETGTNAKQQEENSTEEGNKEFLISKVKRSSSSFPIVDIATCDGPVLFDRILNPNFAVTVEHHQSTTPMVKSPGSTTSSVASGSTGAETGESQPRSNTYLCICCNQSFKSLFCYQKHKKRHLNPVTVDITTTNKNLPLVTVSDNRSQTKDLNVQFFPCKKCGCKFPSYYFVHKHKKVCHQQQCN